MLFLREGAVAVAAVAAPKAICYWWESCEHGVGFGLVGWLVGCVVLQIAQAPAALGWVPEHWSLVCWKLSGSRLHFQLSLVFYRYLD